MTHYIDWETRTKVVLAIIAKESTEQESADALGVDIEEIRIWHSMYIDALCRRDSARESHKRPSKSLVGISSIVAVVILLTVSAAVYSQQSVACAEAGWQTQLFCFTPHTPANADEVNGNFKQVVNWIETKTGPVANGNNITAGAITADSITTTGTVSGTDITSSGTITAGNILDLPFDGTPIEGISAVRVYLELCTPAQRGHIKVKYGHDTGVWSGDYLCVCLNNNADWVWTCLR